MSILPPSCARFLLVAVLLLGLAPRADAIHPAPNRRIAYIEACASPGSLVLIAPDGTGKTPAPFAGITPAWSPDGTRVAYWSGGWVWVANADGSEATIVAAGEHPAWSPNGTSIVFSCERQVFPGGDICVAELETMAISNITHDTVVGVNGVTRFSHSPSWSPDPTDPRIAFYRSESNGFANTVARGIYTISPTGAGLVSLRIDSGTIQGASGYAASDPDWSPDGTRIVFTRQARIDPGKPDTSDNVEQYIATMAADGSDVQRISPPFTIDDHDAYPAWSPDGTLIAFMSDRGDTAERLWVMAPDGQDARRVTPGPACVAPAWEIPPQELKIGPAAITIADWRGEASHDFSVSPTRVTLYGQTVVPVEIRASGAPNTPVTFRAEPEGATVGAGAFGFSTDPDTVGPAEYLTTTDDDGRASLHFVVRDLYAETLDGEPAVTGFRLTVAVASGEPKEAHLDVVDNRARILARYATAQDYVPDGARSVWRDAFLPPLRGPLADLPGALLSAIVQPGNSGIGSILCNSYQWRTLVFLNDLRHSDDGWLMNGIDYAPVQTVQTEHHFVALHPSRDGYAFPRTRILDPWLPQTIAVYTWQEFVNFVDAIGQGSNIVPDARRDAKNPGTCVVQCGLGTYMRLPYPALGGHYPYFPENADLPITRRYDGCLMIPPDWCTRNGFTHGAVPRQAPPPSDHATVVIGSPVLFHVGLADGRGFGWTGPDTFVNDFSEEWTSAMTSYPEPAGGQGWYVEVPPARAFTLATPALADGTMSVGVIGAAGVVWGVYRDVPIATGETVELPVDLDAPCAPLALASGEAVACEQPVTACAAVPSCKDWDPCTDDRCEDGVCTFSPRTGIAAARCACDRPAPAQCAGQAVPRRVTAGAAAACRLLAKADVSASAKTQRRVLGKAFKRWKTVARLARSRKATKALSPGCARALGLAIEDAAVRTRGLVGR